MATLMRIYSSGNQGTPLPRSMDKTGSGDIGLELFYNFNAKSLQLPVFALSSRFDFPQAPILKGWIPH